MTGAHWLTVRQVAERLGFSEDTVRIYCAQGVLPGAAKANLSSSRSHWRIPEQDLENFGARPTDSRVTSLDHEQRKQLLKRLRTS